ncbi:MAG: hypothetical protein AAGA91_19920 [Pseudomonadota bacterium]
MSAAGARLCALVIVGVSDLGQKQFLVMKGDVQELTQSWHELLLDHKP